MLLGGPLANSMLQRYIPGPGNYKDKSTLYHDQGVPTLKSRLPDRSYDHLKKVFAFAIQIPGPGSYQAE